MSYNRTNTFEKQVSNSKNSYLVAEEYRTNPMSRTFGGSLVKVEYTDGSSRIYDNIKNTTAYIRMIRRSNDDTIKNVYAVE